MKKHKFFAWMTICCFLLTMVTGYKRKLEKMQEKTCSPSNPVV